MRLSIQYGHGWFRSARTGVAFTHMTGWRGWLEQTFTTQTPSSLHGSNENRATSSAPLSPITLAGCSEGISAGELRRWSRVERWSSPNGVRSFSIRSMLAQLACTSGLGEGVFLRFRELR